MKLINTDGMALIGPGSEWFWTALSGLVLAITFLAIYRQLRLQRNAADIEQLASFEAEWSSELLVRHKLGVVKAIQAGAGPADLPFGSAYALANFFENVGSLVRRERIEASVLHNASGAAVVPFWLTLAPFVRYMRGIETNQLFEHFEWLAGVMSALDRQQIDVPSYDAAFLASWRAAGIAIYEDQLRVMESLRTVMLASPRVPDPEVSAIAPDPVLLTDAGA